MSEHFIPRVGAVFSADIAVPDHEREVRFYSRVLSTGDTPLWREDLMNNLGMPVIGLGVLTDAHASLPRQWMPHMQVADVAASVECALQLGGTELMHSRNSAGQSEWAVLLDPNAAAFGIIPVVGDAAMPSGGTDTPADGGPVGRIFWLDLTVPDASATRDFYRQVIGWSVADVEMKDGAEQYADYNMLGSDGTPAAGICHARGTNAGLPPVWIIYLPVADLAESVQRVEAEGGRVLKTVRSGDGSIAYAAIQDPVGAHLALMQG